MHSHCEKKNLRLIFFHFFCVFNKLVKSVSAYLWIIYSFIYLLLLSDFRWCGAAVFTNRCVRKIWVCSTAARGNAQAVSVHNHPPADLAFSTDQFSLRWCLCTWKSPSALQPISQKFPQRCLWNSYSGHLINFVERFHFLRLSPPGDQWCDVLGSVPAGSVSSSSTFQIFWDGSHLWWLLCPPVYLLGHFPWLPCPWSKSTGVFGGGCWTLTHASLASHSFRWCLMSSDVDWHIRDKLRPMREHGSV